MTSMLTVAPGAIATYKGQAVVVLRLENLESVVVKVVDTREEKQVPVSALQAVTSATDDTRDLSTIPAESWDEALNTSHDHVSLTRVQTLGAETFFISSMSLFVGGSLQGGFFLSRHSAAPFLCTFLRDPHSVSTIR